MNMRIVQLLIAGFVGLILGWLLGPDIDDIRDDVIARLDAQAPQIASLQTGLAGLEQRLAEAPAAGAGLQQALEQRLAALEAAVAAQSQAVTAGLAEQVNAASTTVQSSMDGLTTQVQQSLDALSAELEDLRREMAAGAEQVASAPTEDEAGRLAEEIGATGAVLLPGQGAIFGGTRIDLVELDTEAGSATMMPEGGDEATVEEGATVELTPNCTVRLAGIASGAAYLMPEDCAEPSAMPAPAPAGGAQEGQPTQPADAQPTGQQAAPAPAGAAGQAAPQSQAPSGSGAPGADRSAQQPAGGADQPGQPGRTGEQPGAQGGGETTDGEGAQPVPQQQERNPQQQQPQGEQPSAQ